MNKEPTGWSSSYAFVTWQRTDWLVEQLRIRHVTKNRLVGRAVTHSSRDKEPTGWSSSYAFVTWQRTDWLVERLRIRLWTGSQRIKPRASLNVADLNVWIQTQRCGRLATDPAAFWLTQCILFGFWFGLGYLRFFRHAGPPQRVNCIASTRNKLYESSHIIDALPPGVPKQGRDGGIYPLNNLAVSPPIVWEWSTSASPQ